MMILAGTFILAMLIILAGAELDRDDEDDLDWEWDKRIWINHLADQSKRRMRRTRSRYSKSGIQKAPRRWTGARQR